MKPRIVVLGAGFGGMELATILSEHVPDEADVTGKGSCFIDFCADRFGRVDIDFLSGHSPTGTFHEPSPLLRAEKEHFGSSRRARWFGRAAEVAAGVVAR
jgi:sulfide:quinone oxidoreductase